jgi:hypothetical protein
VPLSVVSLAPVAVAPLVDGVVAAGELDGVVAGLLAGVVAAGVLVVSRGVVAVSWAWAYAKLPVARAAAIT